MMNNYFDKYLKLRSEVDYLAISLAGEHFGHMQCKAGCCGCCQDYSIFPVEFYAIKSELRMNNINLKDFAEEPVADECVFLKNGICSIYQFRPIICRTHGLPLLYMGEEEWELSICDLNFRNTEDDYFTSENTFPMDKFNSELYMLNQAFISTIPDKGYDSNDLIPVYKLVTCCDESDVESRWNFDDEDDLSI